MKSAESRIWPVPHDPAPTSTSVGAADVWMRQALSAHARDFRRARLHAKVYELES